MGDAHELLAQEPLNVGTPASSPASDHGHATCAALAGSQASLTATAKLQSTWTRYMTDVEVYSQNSSFRTLPRLCKAARQHTGHHTDARGAHPPGTNSYWRVMRSSP